jgi:phosphoadenosine phosphosulfate reductase
MDAEGLTAQQLLAHVVDRFHPRLYLACSFQKEEAVLIDILHRIEPGIRVFALDTHLLFHETYAHWREIEQRYGVRIDVYESPSLDRQATDHGERLWARDPSVCCRIRKVAPLSRALGEVDAWVTGVRREQSPTRATAAKLSWDEPHGLWKANPLADWTDRDVWGYIARHDVPYNPLRDRGYASIGCTHCTRPGVGRGGRWAGNLKTECGLHAE